MKIVGKDEYRVRLEVFEGPLDLLLYLIKREEVDIYDIPIEPITQQYMEYLDLMQVLDLDIAGEFLVMASTLMLIKSRLLLPVEERAEEEAEEEDPRWDLVRQLVEYKKFKDAAWSLHRMEVDRLDVHPRGGETVVPPGGAELALQDVNLFDLMAVFHDALKRVQASGTMQEIFPRLFSVSGKMDDLRRGLRSGERLRLQTFFSGMTTRDEVICSFLAMLEMIRRGEIMVMQEKPFDDIYLEACEVAAATVGDVAVEEEWDL